MPIKGSHFCNNCTAPKPQEWRDWDDLSGWQGILIHSHIHKWLFCDSLKYKEHTSIVTAPLSLEVTNWHDSGNKKLDPITKRLNRNLNCIKKCWKHPASRAACVERETINVSGPWTFIRAEIWIICFIWLGQTWIMQRFGLIWHSAWTAEDFHFQSKKRQGTIYVSVTCNIRNKGFPN